MKKFVTILLVLTFMLLSGCIEKNIENKEEEKIIIITSSTGKSPQNNYIFHPNKELERIEYYSKDKPNPQKKSLYNYKDNGDLFMVTKINSVTGEIINEKYEYTNIYNEYGSISERNISIINENINENIKVYYGYDEYGVLKGIAEVDKKNNALIKVQE